MSNNIDDEYGGLSPDQLTELQNYAGLPVHQQQQNQSYPPISHTDSAGIYLSFNFKSLTLIVISLN